MATKSILKEVKITSKLQANKFVDALTQSEDIKEKRNIREVEYTRAHKHIKNKKEIRTVFSSLFNK